MTIWRSNLRLERRLRARDLAEREAAKDSLLDRIRDVCADIDVWRDDAPGSALAAALERLGAAPTLSALQREHAQLLRQASRRGCVDRDEEEVAAA